MWTNVLPFSSSCCCNRSRPNNVVIVKRSLFLLLIVTSIFLIYLFFKSSEMMSSSMSDDDLTLISWSHAVNSKAKLTSAIQGETPVMLECDVSQGHLVTDPSSPSMPILAHPPDVVSDLSLVDLLEQVVKSGKRKGIKLDFKSMEAVEEALTVVGRYKDQLTLPPWLNADIVVGPGSDDPGLDAGRFLSLCLDRFPGGDGVILSLGWTTDIGEGDVGYERRHVDRMVRVMEEAGLTLPSPDPITFPVRAALLASEASRAVLEDLLRRAGERATLTVWSGLTDLVDFDAAAELILRVGVRRVFLDVPPPQEKEFRVRIG